MEALYDHNSICYFYVIYVQNYIDIYQESTTYDMINTHDLDWELGVLYVKQCEFGIYDILLQNTQGCVKLFSNQIESNIKNTAASVSTQSLQVPNMYN